MKLILIRHGLSKANILKQFCGWTDTPLVEKGALELAELKEKIKFPEVEALFSSPLTRCLDSAKILYPNNQVIIIDNLKEINFGDWEGMSHEQLKDDLYYQNWLENYQTVTHPNGESRVEFLERIKTGFAEVCEQSRQSNYQTVAIMCHSAVIRTYLKEIVCFKEEVSVKNGSGYIIDLETKEVRELGEDNE